MYQISNANWRENFDQINDSKLKISGYPGRMECPWDTTLETLRMISSKGTLTLAFKFFLLLLIGKQNF